MVCVKPYEQVLEEAIAEYLQHTAEIDETVRERYLKRQALIAGLQSGVIGVIPWGMSQAATCHGIICSINNSNLNHEDRGNFLPLFQDKKSCKFMKKHINIILNTLLFSHIYFTHYVPL